MIKWYKRQVARRALKALADARERNADIETIRELKMKHRQAVEAYQNN